MAADKERMCFPLAACVALRSAKEVERKLFATAIAHVAEVGQFSVPFLRAVVQYEVDQSESAATLFRGNTLATTLLTHFALQVSRSTQYLYRILSALIFTVCNQSGWEIEPAFLPPDESLDENRQNLSAAVEMFLSKILGSVPSFPAPLREVCVALERATAAKYPEHSLIAVGGFVLLRLICPAILSPLEYGIRKEELPPSAKKPLTLISRTLMCLSNQQQLATGGGKDWLAPLNAIVAQYAAPMRRFFSQLSQPLPPEDADERGPWPPAAPDRNLFETMAFIVAEHSVALTASLQLLWPGSAEQHAQQLSEFKKLQISAHVETDSSLTPATARQMAAAQPPSSISLRVYLTDSVVLRSMGMHRSFKTVLLRQGQSCAELLEQLLRKMATGLDAARLADLQVECADYAVWVETKCPKQLHQMAPTAQLWDVLQPYFGQREEFLADLHWRAFLAPALPDEDTVSQRRATRTSSASIQDLDDSQLLLLLSEL